MSTTSAQFKSEIEKAVKALYKYHQQPKGEDSREEEKKSLFVETPFEYVWIVLAVKKLCHPKVLPFKIPIPNPFRSDSCLNNDVCLITENPAEKYEKLLASKGIKAISKVIDISQLKSTYKQFEARRLLCASYDYFWPILNAFLLCR